VMGHLMNSILAVTVVGEEETLGEKSEACRQELDIFRNCNLFENPIDEWQEDLFENLFEDQDVSNGIDEEESTHGDVLSVQEESILSPKTSEKLPQSITKCDDNLHN